MHSGRKRTTTATRTMEPGGASRREMNVGEHRQGTSTRRFDRRRRALGNPRPTLVGLLKPRLCCTAHTVKQFTCGGAERGHTFVKNATTQALLRSELLPSLFRVGLGCVGGVERKKHSKAHDCPAIGPGPSLAFLSNTTKRLTAGIPIPSECMCPEHFGV